AGQDFRGAAAQVRVAEAQGAGAAWAGPLHQRIRGLWRQFAGERPTADARLSEFDDFLKEYPDDQAAKAKAEELRRSLALQRRLDEALDKLVGQSDFRGAVARLRAAEGQGADAAWAAGWHERARAAWRRSAAAKPTDEAQLSEFDAILKEYPDDADARGR